MMFEILEPCRALRLGTSSKKIKQTKIMIKRKKERASKEKKKENRR